jgi:hypothetical protein
MKKGEIVYCKVECFSLTDKNIFFTEGKYYEVIKVLPTIVIIQGNKQTKPFFHKKVIGALRHFKDHFYTESELRKEKLKRLENGTRT